nr:DNA ligase (ATP) [Polyrhizophydium stewartii]
MKTRLAPISDTIASVASLTASAGPGQPPPGSFGRMAAALSLVRRQVSKDSKLAILRTLLDLDTERAMGIREKSLARVYIKALGLAATSRDAEALLRYRDPSKAAGSVGDFPALLKRTVACRSTVRGVSALTIQQVNDKLDELARPTHRGILSSSLTSGPSSASAPATAASLDDRLHIFRFFLASLSPDEHAWLARIILKDLDIGVSEVHILPLFHPDAYETFNFCTSLRVVAEKLRDPLVRIGRPTITLFQPFRPMLSLRSSPNDTVAFMKGEPFWIESKLDGERFLVHMQRGTFMYWSRRSKDFTGFYGSTKARGALTPHIWDCIDASVTSCILDGEMMTFNSQTGELDPLSKFENARNEIAKSDRLQPCLVVFDMVFLNGRSLADEPLSARRERLGRLVRPKLGRLSLMQYKVATTAREIVKCLDEHMLQMHEGLIVKNPASKYVPDEKLNWIKIKPDYIDALGDDLDLVVVGGYFGNGNRANKLSQFLCAVRDDRSTASDGAQDSAGCTQQQPRFLTVCRIGSGFTANEIADISREHEGHWQMFDPSRCPAWLAHPPGAKDRPDMIIHPDVSRVVQVRGAQIVKSDSVAAGHTVRFPRFIRVRSDKTHADIMSVTELEAYVARNGGRMQRTLRDARGHEVAAASGTLLPDFVGADLSDVVLEDTLFRGIEFLVLPTVGGAGGAAPDASRGHVASDPVLGSSSPVMPFFPTRAPGPTLGSSQLVVDAETKAPNAPRPISSKHALEIAIAEHGGRCVQLPSATTKLVVTDTVNARAASLIKANKYDVVQSQYVRDCIAAGRVIPMHPRYLVHGTPATVDEMRWRIDDYGDSYYDDVDVEQLREIFSAAKDPMPVCAESPAGCTPGPAMTRLVKRRRTAQECCERYFSGGIPGIILMQVVAYVDRYPSVRVHAGLFGIAVGADATGLDLPGEACIVGDDAADPTAAAVDATDQYAQPGQFSDSHLELTALQIRAHGGVVVACLCAATTHVVVARSQRDRGSVFRRIRLAASARDAPLFHVVDERWVGESIARVGLADENAFAI